MGKEQGKVGTTGGGSWRLKAGSWKRFKEQELETGS